MNAANTRFEPSLPMPLIRTIVRRGSIKRKLGASQLTEQRGFLSYCRESEAANAEKHHTVRRPHNSEQADCSESLESDHLALAAPARHECSLWPSLGGGQKQPLCPCIRYEDPGRNPYRMVGTDDGNPIGFQTRGSWKEASILLRKWRMILREKSISTAEN